MSWLAMMMPARVREWWMAGTMAGLVYGGLLVTVAMDSPPGAPLNGQIAFQPVWKTAMALLLVRAAHFHPVRRERRWLMAALLFSALGDFLLAMPWLSFSFIGGLGAFLIAHFAYLGLFVPMAGDGRAHRLIACGAVVGAAGVMVARFWPNLGTLAVPVSVYVGALTAMACAALLAKLPTPLAALGALCFAVSDGLLGTARFLVPFDTFALGIWWTYAAAQVLLVAGVVAGRDK
ncbi:MULTISPECIES: lysoplasmalogenase [unclassified Cupriavidus]|uniref:lysoplasmalogenase n=1 Tax=Cupriavidus TaxID=106589 RepID=UPI00226E16EC|nr:MULTISPECIES: lysoplasmalogenase [unclassified Cupriavidus]MCY0857021.1 lysoplasmalogenase [Cupriavidus sp. D39]MDW3683577.1 lysoplasmalogenase [Cupriavidus sp. CV2]